MTNQVLTHSAQVVVQASSFAHLQSQSDQGTQRGAGLPDSRSSNEEPCQPWSLVRSPHPPSHTLLTAECSSWPRPARRPGQNTWKAVWPSNTQEESMADRVDGPQGKASGVALSSHGTWDADQLASRPQTKSLSSLGASFLLLPGKATNS